ncbi:sigma-70 family RNA polymerase sigma factor [Paractinoplanes atraurantiacus]|uniref:RNA polymerase sigma factor, sigma-70 family n=1 Tax=Paractinoplanes atraurantiacus TaxID=1036182 RepID=A0A285K6M8_9ACTN|nr:sigma-70 family RNA polymerase sigma factor [Actinoplanes atraurantiacus]SNY66971.1 RNA polymerase sigma factor, sigma-70 family [Actinoplanes atraurantiacus]
MAGEVPERPVHENQDRPALVAALKKLPPRQRAVLVLRFVYDLPVGEVAEMLDISDGTVKSQSAKGLAKMRHLLEEPVAAAQWRKHGN